MTSAARVLPVPLGPGEQRGGARARARCGRRSPSRRRRVARCRTARDERAQLRDLRGGQHEVVPAGPRLDHAAPGRRTRLPGAVPAGLPQRHGRARPPRRRASRSASGEVEHRRRPRRSPCGGPARSPCARQRMPRSAVAPLADASRGTSMRDAAGHASSAAPSSADRRPTRGRARSGQPPPASVGSGRRRRSSAHATPSSTRLALQQPQQALAVARARAAGRQRDTSAASGRTAARPPPRRPARGSRAAGPCRTTP